MAVIGVSPLFYESWKVLKMPCKYAYMAVLLYEDATVSPENKQRFLVVMRVGEGKSGISQENTP